MSVIALPVLAQLDTGTITGTVHDSSGAAVPNAQVAVRNDATAQILELKVNEQGTYVSPPLRPGEYTVTITAEGFEKIAKRLQLDVSQRAVVDFDLKLGTVTQEVAVVDVKSGPTDRDGHFVEPAHRKDNPGSSVERPQFRAAFAALCGRNAGANANHG